MDDSPTRRAGLVVAVLSLCGTVVAVMQTLVIPLLPEFPTLLGTSPDTASWLVTATLLSGAISTPIASRLADMAGKRRMMLVCLAALTVGSVLGALSESLVGLVLARALQGTALALIPIGISIMRDELPTHRVGSAVALMSATLGIGATVGLPLGGLIEAHLDWHALFWVSAVLGAIMSVVVLVVVPESTLVSGGRFDLVGALLLAGALAGLLLALSKGGIWGWSDQRTVFAAVSGALVLIVWVSWELRAGHPLVDIRTSVRKPVLVTNLASVAAGFAMFGNLIGTTQQLELPRVGGDGFGLSAAQAGLGMVPGGLVMVALAPASARISQRFGARATLIAGGLVMAIAYAGRAAFSHEVWQVVSWSAVVQAGTALAFAAMPILIMRFVPITETAAANGLNTLFRSIGTATSSAALVAIVSAYSVSVDGVVLPGPEAFRTVFIACGGAAMLSVLAATLLPRAAMQTGDGVVLKVSSDTTMRSPSGREVVSRGRVVRPDGRPMRHAVVSVIRLDGDQVDWARADSDGVWSVVVPEAGRYLLVCWAEGWAPRAQLTEMNRSGEDVDVEVGDRRTLTGTITRAGIPVRQALVAVTQPSGEAAGSARTDHDGRYEIALPPNGHYIMTVLDASREEAQSRELLVTAGRRLANFELEAAQAT